MNVERIAEALVSRGQTVSVAEADTCGLVDTCSAPCPEAPSGFREA